MHNLNDMTNESVLNKLIKEGNMEEYYRLTGCHYSIEGTIIEGNHIGRTIDVPTINQVPSDADTLPPFGVYYSEIILDNKNYYGITNIGKKPTVNDSDAITAETFIFNFNQSIYGSHARVILHHFSRPEQKFANLGALKAQIKKDIEGGNSYFIKK